MKIAVVGTGYVGLVTGTCFADTGNTVTCIDIDNDKVESLKNGQITIYEPGLEKIFIRNQREGRISFTTSLKEGINGAKIIFLALPTPPNEDGSADLKYILSVSSQLGKIISTEDFTIIVDKSTVPVGTTAKVRQAILDAAKEANRDVENVFDVVSNPEFLKEGVAVDDFMKPDRIVIGTSSEQSEVILKNLYEPFVRQGNPIIFMDEKSAELTKYAANSFLATKISFMNEIANLCEILGANVDMVRKGIGTDLRIGKQFLYPGLGYGGSCFPKDVQALSKSATDNNYDFKILTAVTKVNKLQRALFFNKISNYFNNDFSKKSIAIWGLSFKPNTDDIREAPALYIIDELLKHGALVTVFDPEANNNVQKIYNDKINFAADQYEALTAADALIICTEWNEFRSPDFERMYATMKGKIIFDGRNLFDVIEMKKKNFTYQSIGRDAL